MGAVTHSPKFDPRGFQLCSALSPPCSSARSWLSPPRSLPSPPTGPNKVAAQLISQGPRPQPPHARHPTRHHRRHNPITLTGNTPRSTQTTTAAAATCRPYWCRCPALRLHRHGTRRLLRCKNRRSRLQRALVPDQRRQHRLTRERRGKSFFTSEPDNVFVVPATDKFFGTANNSFCESCLFPSLSSGGALFFRTRHQLIAAGAKH